MSCEAASRVGDVCVKNLVEHAAPSLLMELENDDNFVVANTAVINTLCHTCNRKTAKYKCPACYNWNCSLLCVEEHKRTTQCSGVKPAVQHIPITHFTDATLYRDVRFLDRVSQVAERAARVTARQFSARLQQSSYSAHGRRTLLASVFRKKCEERGIYLRLCPPELSMRRRNTTQVTRKTKRLAWRIEWKFPEWNNTAYVDIAVSEETVLLQLLQRFVIPNNSVEGTSSCSEKIGFSRTRPVYPSIPPVLPATGEAPPYCQDYHVLFKDHSVFSGTPKDDTLPHVVPSESPRHIAQQRWFVLDKHKKLGVLLKNKHVYEFPIFYVVSDTYLASPMFQNSETVLIKDV